MENILTATRIKICGVTTPGAALAVAAAGADAVGLNFHPDSPRYVDPDRARRIVAALPPFVTVVGLFVNCPAERLAETLRTVPLDLLQFHGDEAPADCSRWARPWIRALRVGAPDWERRLAELEADPPLLRGVLLDAFVPGVPGGTGQRFDWARIPAGLPHALVLAGGLTPANVATAIEQVRPWAVDVSGGVECEPGVKDPERIRAFCRSVRETDARLSGSDALQPRQPDPVSTGSTQRRE